MCYGISFIIATIVGVMVLVFYIFLCKKSKLDAEPIDFLMLGVVCFLVWNISNSSFEVLDFISMDNDNVVEYRNVYTKNISAIDDDKNIKEKKYFKKLDNSIQIIIDDGESKQFKNIDINNVNIVEDGKTEIRYFKEYRTGWISKFIGEESNYAESYYELHVPKEAMDF